jgi:hypothetical protein
MKQLFLILKGEWFKKILSGEKKEEYRDITDYWEKRLNKQYDAVTFQHGYGKNAPRVTVELLEIKKGRPNPQWSPQDYWEKDLFILQLGEIKEKSNV